MHSNLIQQRLPLRRHEEIGIPPHGLPLGGQPHAQFDSLLRDIVHREVQMAMGLVVGLCHLVFLPPSFPIRVPYHSDLVQPVFLVFLCRAHPLPGTSAKFPALLGNPSSQCTSVLGDITDPSNSRIRRELSVPARYRFLWFASQAPRRSPVSVVQSAGISSPPVA